MKGSRERTAGVAGRPRYSRVSPPDSGGWLAGQLRSPRPLFVVLLLAVLLLVALGLALMREDPPVVKVASEWPYDVPLSCSKGEGHRAHVQAVSDLTGDGRPEFFVVASCLGNTSRTPEVLYAYQSAGGRSAPELLGVLLDQDDGPNGQGVYKIRVETNRRQVSVNWEDVGQFNYMTYIFRWTGTAFDRAQTSTEVIGD